jgi:hypothetical protein
MEVELGELAPAEAVRDQRRDRKRKTAMVVDGGDIRKLLLARRAKVDSRRSGQRRGPGRGTEL